MARKTEVVTIKAENRDQGKKFLISEPSAMQGEAIFTEASALCEGEISLSGLLNKMTTDRGREFWSGLLNLVEFLPNGNIESRRKIDVDDIEEIPTIMDLKRGALNMILGFHATYSPLNTDREEAQ